MEISANELEQLRVRWMAEAMRQQKHDSSVEDFICRLQKKAGIKNKRKKIKEETDDVDTL